MKKLIYLMTLCLIAAITVFVMTACKTKGGKTSGDASATSVSEQSVETSEDAGVSENHSDEQSTEVSASDSAEQSADSSLEQPVIAATMTIRSQPDKTEYFVGEELDPTGLTVTIGYTDESSKDVTVTYEMLSGFNTSAAGEQTVTITYIEDDVTLTAQFDITVSELPEVEDYLFTVGDEYCWDIYDDVNGNPVFESLSNTQLLMFNKLTFTGGSVSFKMSVASNDYTYLVSCGVAFAADTLDIGHDRGNYYVCGRDAWNEYLCYAKINGGFDWQADGKVTGVMTELNTTYSLKFVWNPDDDEVYYFIEGEYVGTGKLNKGFNGQYIGIYADVAGTVISDIVIDPEDNYRPPVAVKEDDNYYYTEGDSLSWTITEENGVTTYRANGAPSMLMFKNKTFSGGSVSFKLKMENNTYVYNSLVGIVFGCDTANANIPVGKYYVVGRETWSGYNAFSKDNGEFLWQDTGCIRNAMPDIGVEYTLKFIWDSENDLVHYYMDGNYLGTGTLNKGFTGQYVGIYVESKNAEISDIVFDETETYSPPVAVKEDDDYYYTEGDSFSWDITESEGVTSYSAKVASCLLTFKNKTFTGGSVSFKMSVPSNSYTYFVSCGVAFAADTTDIGHDRGNYYVCGRDAWNEYLCYAKINGGFDWQADGKVTGVMTELNTTYSLKFVWNPDDDEVYYFIEGEYVGTGKLNKGFNGQYIGIYADVAGTVISDIVIDPEDNYRPPVAVKEDDNYYYTEGDSLSWTITEENGVTTYRANGAPSMLMFKNKTFSGGSVSFKLKMENNTYVYNSLVGIVFGCDTANANIPVGKYYVVGRETWSGYNAFSKDNGEFLWQDTGCIRNAMPDIGVEYTLKFIWDSENDLVHYYMDGNYLGTGTLNKGFTGQYVGIYVESKNAEISDIVFDETETYTPAA